MGQHLWMSTNHIVIHSYSPVADFLLVVMCLLSLFCLYIAYLKILIVFSKDVGRKYTILSHCILLVFGIADLLA